jgi:hypothetical protein
MSKSLQNVTYGLADFVHEDVAGGKLWQEILDGVTDGFQLSR